MQQNVAPYHVLQRSPKQRFWGAMSPTKRAYLVLHGSPWVYTYPHCHQMITQHQPKGTYALLKVTQESPSLQHSNMP